MNTGGFLIEPSSLFVSLPSSARDSAKRMSPLTSFNLTSLGSSIGTNVARQFIQFGVVYREHSGHTEQLQNFKLIKLFLS